MRILQVTPTYPPAWSYGGITRVVYEITKGLSKRGHDVEVWASDALDRYSRVKNVYSEAGERVRYFKNLSFTLTRMFYDIHITPDIVTFAKEKLCDFDVVHLHGARTFQSLAVYPFVKKYGVPYILQAHGAFYSIGPKQPLHWIHNMFVGHRLLRDASKVIALTHIEALQYRGMGVPEKKIEIIPNGIDLSEYGDLPPKGSFKKKFFIDEDEKIVLYLGRIHESKGLDLLAEAFSIVTKKLENVRLAVVGPDDGYASAFSTLISSLGIEEKVLLTGFVEEEDKFAALVDSDVFVTPRFHGFPVSFLEACLVGCPMVTTSDELDWIQDNVGYVVENSHMEFAKAISEILQDDGIRERFRNNCKFAIKEFDISTVTFQLENIYLNL